jgi:hypothetical protein
LVWLFLTSGPALHVTHNACTSFEWNFPALHELDLEFMSQNEKNLVLSVNKTNEIPWVGVVQRGGCPFDLKVLFMQKAGFTAVLVYNSARELREATVRMSSHDVGDKITVFSAFLSRGAGLALVSHINISKAITFINLKPKLSTFSEWINRKTILSGLTDMFVLFVLVVFTGSGFLMVGIFLNLSYNLFNHGDFMFFATLHEASMIILAVSNQSPSQPKLSRVEFPRRSIVEIDLTRDWRCGGVQGQESCPICIEEYQIGDQVRELPCRHLFHDTW